MKFETQTKYARLKDEVQLIDHKKVSRHELENMNNQITCLRKITSQLSATCKDKRNEIAYEIAYLQSEIQQLEG